MKNCDIEKIITLYCDELLSVSEVGKRLNINRHTVSRILKENNIDIRITTDSPTKIYDENNPRKEIVEDTNKLKQLFYDSQPVSAISKELGIGRRAVERTIKELGLIRTKSMMSREQYDNCKDEEIIRLYNEGKSPEQIGNVVGLSRCGVKNHLKHNNIELRNISESLFCVNGKDFPHELTNYNDLYDLYVVRRLSKSDISKTYNIAPNVVDRVLRKFGIHVRGDSEAKIGLCAGDKHPNWKGGVTGLYALLREHFSITQNKEVIKRDGYKCTMCDSKKNLQVHHKVKFSDIFYEILSENPELDVDRNKKELYDIMVKDERFNDLDNLITYCKECHLFKVHNYTNHNVKN